MAEGLTKALAKRQLPKELYDTIFAEAAGGKPEEIVAVASAFLNRADELGFDKALLGSSAYRKKSKQYVKANTENFNPYEAKVYGQIKDLVDLAVTERDPYWFFENIEAYGNPPWLSDTEGDGVKVGRQTFYRRKR